MGEHRLVNARFILSGSHINNLSNKAKLLYFLMLMSADNKGFVDTTETLIKALEDNDKEYNKSISLELLDNTYHSAINELIDKGLLFEFTDKHKNKIHLVKHWFIHNKWTNGLSTNYNKFLTQVHLEEGEYVWGKKPLKENNNIKQNNVNQNNVREDNENDDNDDEYELNESDYPFPL